MIEPLQPGAARDLPGAFLDLDLRAASAGGPRIVANFIASLDGRIALDAGKGLAVPAATANERDWRLFQELAAQADVVLVAARLARECAAGTAQAPPPVDAVRHPDLIDWRRARGLVPQPALWVLASGTRPLPQAVLADWARGREVRVLAPQAVDVPDGVRLERLEHPAALRARLAAAGARLAYFAAGGRLHRALLAAGAVDELFLTVRLAVLGGERFATIADGPAVLPPAGFALAGAWLDTAIAPPQLLLRLRRLAAA